MLGPPPSTGASYSEDKYYDPVARTASVGGVADRLGNRYKQVAPFHEVFDWEPPHLWGVTIYYFPMTVSRAELRKIEQILHSSEDDELVLYFGGTDALGHVRGMAGPRGVPAPRGPGRSGASWPRGAPSGASCCSRTTGRRPSRAGGWTSAAALEKGGYRLKSRLERPGDVVAPAYGLVGAIPLYTRCGEEEAVARAVAARAGSRLRRLARGGRGEGGLRRRPARPARPPGGPLPRPAGPGRGGPAEPTSSTRRASSSASRTAGTTAAGSSTRSRT